MSVEAQSTSGDDDVIGEIIPNLIKMTPSFVVAEFVGMSDVSKSLLGFPSSLRHTPLIGKFNHLQNQAGRVIQVFFPAI